MNKRSLLFLVSLIVVVLLGIASRLFHTGFAVFDKYLGDALYAVMFYLLLSLLWPGGAPLAKAGVVMVSMVVIETFQLTQIPLMMSRSDSLALRLVAIFLGTKFSWLDMLAYLVGIGVVFGIDHLVFSKAPGVSKFRNHANR